MKGMILAAGLGTRLRPLTLSTPKSLIEVGGKPLIMRALEYMHQAGVQKIAINTHYLAEQIPETLGDAYRGIPISYLHESEILGTGGGLKNACEQVLGFDTPIFLMNSDIVMDFDVKAFLAEHQKHQALATLLLKTVERGPDYVEIGSDAKGQIRTMIGLVPYKGPQLKERLFCGTHLISPEALKYFPAKKSFSIIQDFYVPILQQGLRLWGVEQSSYYCDVGTLQRLEEAKRHFSKNNRNHV